MKLKQAIAYRFNIAFKITAIFFLFYGLVTGFSALMNQINHRSDLITGDIFLLFLPILFAIAVTALREEFRLFMQFGMSRKNIFLSSILSLSLLSAGFSLLTLLIWKISDHSKIFQAKNSLVMAFGPDLSSLKNVLLAFILSMLVCLAVIAVGLVISSAFQHFSRIAFLTIFIAVLVIPVFLKNIFNSFPPESRRHFVERFLSFIGQGSSYTDPHVSRILAVLSVFSIVLLGIYYWFQRHQELSYKGK